MSKTSVKKKRLDEASNVKSGWMELAEDAERDAVKARKRCEQLTEAARIFRRNAESGTRFPQSDDQKSGQQHSV